MKSNWKRMNESDLSPMKKERLMKLRKMSGMDSDEAEELLDDCGWDLDAAIAHLKSGKKKKPKDKKIFKVGDKVVCIDPKPGKNMPPDCVDFMMTYKYFKVIDVNDKLNIDLGHRLAENGNPYYFSPNRFELKDGVAPVRKADGTEEQPKPNDPADMDVTAMLKAGMSVDQIAKAMELKKKTGLPINVEPAKKKIVGYSDYKGDEGDWEEEKPVAAKPKSTPKGAYGPAC